MRRLVSLRLLFVSYGTLLNERSCCLCAAVGSWESLMRKKEALGIKTEMPGGGQKARK